MNDFKQILTATGFATLGLITGLTTLVYFGGVATDSTIARTEAEKAVAELEMKRSVYLNHCKEPYFLLKRSECTELRQELI